MVAKPWYQSKAVWAGIVAVLLATYEAFNLSLAPVLGFSIPPIPEWVYGLLAAFGIYSRITATTTISK